MVNIHELKTDPEVFIQSLAGDKPWEIRLNDRQFQVNDMIVLRETKYSSESMNEGMPLKYTGRLLSRRITYVMPNGSYGLDIMWTVMTVVNI